MHTRFEHSLGEVHVATKMFDALTENSKEFLRSEMNFTDDALRRDRMLVRLAALLQDGLAGKPSAQGITRVSASSTLQLSNS